MQISESEGRPGLDALDGDARGVLCEAFGRHDEDGDGVLDALEFGQLWDELSAATYAVAPRRRPGAATTVVGTGAGGGGTAPWDGDGTGTAAARRTAVMAVVTVAPPLTGDELREAYEHADIDKDGILDLNEVASAIVFAWEEQYVRAALDLGAASARRKDAAQSVLLQRALPTAARLMREFDADRDGVLTASEFADGMRLLVAAGRALPKPRLTTIADDDASLTALFRAADIDADQRLDLNEWLLLTHQLTHFKSLTKDKHSLTLAQECAAYAHKPWACPLLRELRKTTDTIAADEAARARAAAARRRGSHVHGGLDGDGEGDGASGAFDSILAQFARPPKPPKQLLTAQERRWRRARNKQQLRDQLRQVERAYELKVLEGAGDSAGVVDGHGRRVLRARERQMLPLLREFDSSGEGVLRLSEFRLMLKQRFEAAGRAKETPSMVEALKMFNTADRNGGGTLGVDELVTILESFELPPERADYLR